MICTGRRRFERIGVSAGPAGRDSIMLPWIYGTDVLRARDMRQRRWYTASTRKEEEGFVSRSVDELGSLFEF
jgi:hypothetical protein